MSQLKPDQNSAYSVLADLTALIASRKTESPDKSYTAQLLGQGVEKCAQKFGEEAVETVIALVSGKQVAIKSEAADVMYHLLVALEAADVRFEDVLAELQIRSGQSGLAEKALRSAK